MNPLLYILITVILISVSGILLAPKTNNILFAWLWFNVFIAIYEFYIVWKRNEMVMYKDIGENMDFWNTSSTDYFWRDAWGEYSYNSDRRYLEPTDFVYWIEFGNAIIVLLLWMAFISNNMLLVKVLLVIQAYHCGIYFLSWYYTYGNTRFSNLQEIYLGISALWIICPVALLFILK